MLESSYIPKAFQEAWQGALLEAVHDARSSAPSGEVEGAEYVTETESRRLTNQELERRRVYPKVLRSEPS